MFLSNNGELVVQINDLHLLKQRVFRKTVTGVTYACWLCDYKTANERYKKWILKYLNVYLNNKFQFSTEIWNIGYFRFLISRNLHERVWICKEVVVHKSSTSSFVKGIWSTLSFKINIEVNLPSYEKLSSENSNGKCIWN